MTHDEREPRLDPRLREAADRLPRSIEPPTDLWPGIHARIRAGEGRGDGRNARSPSRRWLPLAAAALLLLSLGVWRLVHRDPGGEGQWDVRRLAGTPRVGDAAIGQLGTIRVGQWLVTDDSSRAVIDVGDIGTVDVKPGSRVRVVTARPTDHRLALAFGSIDAKVDAPPRLFFVDTPAGTAVDLGCAYTLDVDSAGNGVLRVTQGYVEFDWSGRRSIVPLGAVAQIRVGVGPGTPYVDDAPAALRRALFAFDFGAGGRDAVRAALAAARAEDALSLWHLLSRVAPDLRPAVYDRLVALVPPPAGVSRDSALRLDAATLDRYWQKIRRIAWRRVILRGVREIDPRTGLTRPDFQTSPRPPASER
jgi:FecR protein